MKLLKTYLLTLLTFLFVLSASSQTYQLDQFDKNKAFSSSGGINFSQIFYTPMGGEKRRLPYTYNLSGNLTATVFGFSFPFSFNISNQQTSFRQPFNQLKIAPKYKWVQLHLGNSSMNWSPLTLAGHNFNGYGVDLTPEKFKLSAMYGTLLQPIAIDTLNANNIASFKRTGFGLKFGTKLAKGNIEFIGFGAYDDPNSIPLVEGYEEALKPESNLVFSLKTNQQITKKLTIDLEWATSALSQVIREEGAQGVQLPKFGKNSAETSSFHQAVKTNINYNFGKSSIGVGYERVSPEYRTLGAYFFNNNLENVTLNGKTGLFKQKVQLSGSVGLQRDNLAKTEISSMNRVVSSVNVSYAPNKKLNLSGSYSNFISNSIIRPEIDEINPLLPNQPITAQDFTQLSHNSSLNASYILKAEKENSQLLNLNLSQQIASNEQNGQKQNSGTQFYNANLSYTRKTKKLGSISATLNGNMNKAQNVQTIALAPGLTYSKLIKEKLQASLGATYSLAFNNKIASKNVANFRLNLGYSFKKSHQFSLGSIYLYSPAANTQTKLSELTTTLNYSYRFSMKPRMIGKKAKKK